jgi:acyl carrier protein
MKTIIRLPGRDDQGSVAEKLREIIHYKLGVDVEKLHENTHFQDDLGIDSLDLIELRMEIEKVFGITITDEETEKLTTVGSFIECVSSKKYSSQRSSKL